MMQRLTFVLALLLLSVTAFATQQLSSFGRDFYLAYTETSFRCTAYTKYQVAFAIVSAPYDCNVQVSYFDKTTGQEFLERTVHVNANNSGWIPIIRENVVISDGPGKPNANTDGEIAEYTACHLHADNAVTVSYYSTGPDNGAMYLALPTSVLGKHYVVAAAPNGDGTGAGLDTACMFGLGEPSSSMFCVLAITDGTHVTIIPSGTTRKAIPGVSSGPGANGTPVPMRITLQRGQVFWVKSDIKSNPWYGDIDMTGSQITSDMPVAVLGGCENALNQPSGNRGDMRNLNLQMMIPVEYWAKEGYLMMPMKDTPGLDAGNNSWGDLARLVFADTTKGPCSITSISDVGPRLVPIESYQYPPASVENLGHGAIFYSQCNLPFSVEQFDYSAGSKDLPFTAPTMMNVIPLKSFARACMWTVPDELNPSAKFRFINVIADAARLNKIKLWKDGKPLGSISSLPTSGSTTFPVPYDHFVGRRYSLGIGNYYATSDSQFCVYNYGMTAFSPDRSLGPGDSNDYFTEFASPCGQNFGIDGAFRPTMTADTFCSNGPYWIVHVSDTAKVDNYIAGLDILKDPLGVIKRRPDSDTGYTSYNVQFEPADFTVVPGHLTKLDAKIVVTDPLQNAEAWVWAVNGAGNDTLIHLYYIAPKLHFGAIQSNGVSTMHFDKVPTDIDTCSIYVLRNAGGVASPTFHISSVSFLNGGLGVFTVTTVDLLGNPVTMPVTLKPGDSIMFHVCFKTSQTGRVYSDTLVVQTECLAAFGPIIATTKLPEISATDLDFGAVIVGKTACSPVTIRNTGDAAFTLTKQWAMTNYGGFEFTLTAPNLPITLQPSETISIEVCYSPTDTVADSSVITWGTDIAKGYETNRKNYSILVGKGIIDRDVARSERPAAFTVALSPNPATNEVTVTLESDRVANATVEVLDLLGGRVTMHEARVGAGANRIHLDTHALSAGTYYVRISVGGEVITRRIVKE